MRRRVSWLVAATTSAVVLAFVIPLCLLVRTLAADRALAGGNEEAQSVAVLVSALDGDAALAEFVTQTDDRVSAAATTVLLADGTVLGRADDALVDDPRVDRAESGASFTDVGDAGADIFRPVITEAGTAVVVTRVPRELMEAGVHQAWAGILGLGALLLVAALVVADRLGRRVSTPVTELATVAARLHEGDLRARAEPTGPEETVELGETLNRLADRIVELLAAERAAVGDLSHRLRTPVTALRLDAEALRDDDVTERMRQHIEQLQRTIDAIVRDARRPLHDQLVVDCDAAAVVHERAAFWSALAEDQGRPVEVEVPNGEVRVGLDASGLTDVVDVLVDNVFAHTAEDTAFVIRLTEQGVHAVLEVIDRGGRGAERADGPRPGTSGLGLQIVRRTVAAVGGHLVWSRAADGVHAVVTLPLVRAD